MSLFELGDKEAALKKEKEAKMVADFMRKYERENPGKTLTFHGKLNVDDVLRQAPHAKNPRPLE